MGDIRQNASARLQLMTSVLLSFTAHILGRRALKEPCSPGGLNHHCATAATGRPLAPVCIYCAIHLARGFYRLLDPTATDADLTEAAALAAADAERRELHHYTGTGWLDNGPSETLTAVAYDRMHAAVTA